MKALVIVDIQKSMGNWFTWTYINKVNKFLKTHSKEYDKVLMLLEPNITSEEYKVMSLHKADKKKIAQIIDSLEEDEVPSFILDYLTSEPIYKMYSNHLYNRMFVLGILPKSDFINLPNQSLDRSSPLYMSPELKGFIASLEGCSQVDLIGGGETGSITLTQKLLTYHDISSIVLSDMCYDKRYENTNRRDGNIFETTPIKVSNKKPTTEEGVFALTKIPF